MARMGVRSKWLSCSHCFVLSILFRLVHTVLSCPYFFILFLLVFHNLLGTSRDTAVPLSPPFLQIGTSPICSRDLQNGNVRDLSFGADATRQKEESTTSIASSLTTTSGRKSIPGRQYVNTPRDPHTRHGAAAPRDPHCATKPAECAIAVDETTKCGETRTGQIRKKLK